MPALARALRPASKARSEVAWEGSAMCRKRMPVWEWIHSSEVSRKLANSSFAILLSGTEDPTARITALMARIVMLSNRAVNYLGILALYML